MLELSPQELENLAKRHIMRTWDHSGLTLTEGKGVKVRDIWGKEYIDCTSQAWTLAVGYSHPKVIQAVRDQLNKMVQVFASFYNVPQIMLAKKLAELTPPEFTKVAFTLSGADAIEGAMRLAMRYTGGQDFITLYHGYHGRTFSTTAMSHTYPSYVKCKRGVERFIPKPTRVPNFYCYRCYFDKKYPQCDLFCAKFLERALDHAVDSKVAGVLLEPIQGNGGHIFPPPGYLKRLGQICTERDIPLIYDEIQTGFGRCGTWFAAEAFGAFPDILVVGKGLGGGFPITGIITSEKFDLFNPGDWGSTQGGNPISCTAALATIKVIEEEQLLENAKVVGRVFMDRMKELAEVYEFIGDVRGIGLFLSVEIVQDKKSKKEDPQTALGIVRKALQKGVIIAKSGIGDVGNVLKIKPPLSITVSEMEKVVDVLEVCFREMTDSNKI